MIWVLWCVLVIFNTFVIVTVVDAILFGTFRLNLSRKCTVPKFVVGKANRIDTQVGLECSGFASAYVLRHYGIPAEGAEVHGRMPNKTADGRTFLKGVKKLLAGYGFRVKLCAGNLNALKNEVQKGAPVIVLIRVRMGGSALHFVPVVGYDEENVFLAESMPGGANCSEKLYNRKVPNRDFLALWNTSMLRMPLYTHIFYVVRER